MQKLLPSRLPRVRLPPLSCDCHMHAYGEPSRYPANPASPFKAVPDGTIENYLRLRRILGLARAVVVQPSAYGFDNRCTLDALAKLGDAGRAVLVVDHTATDADLETLTKAGAKGLRFFMLEGGALGWEELPRLAARVAEFGWHIQLQMDGRFLHEREDELSRLPCPLVIDHNGKFLEPVDLGHPGFAALCRLMEAGRTWVKTSGVYETSRLGPPDYADVAILPRALISRYAERCVWATNWPHPSKPGDPPDDSLLLEQFVEWCGSPATVERVLVANPAELYGFD